MAGATTCPECGGRVSAYAAGCEHCGADLEAHARRARVAAANAPPPRGPSKLRTSLRRGVDRLGVTRAEVLVIGLTLVLLRFLPALALLVAALAIMHGIYEGRRGWTALFVAFAILGLVLALTGQGEEVPEPSRPVPDQPAVMAGEGDGAAVAAAAAAAVANASASASTSRRWSSSSPASAR